jgi:multiple sugar transport system substrate-binding protein
MQNVLNFCALSRSYWDSKMSDDRKVSRRGYVKYAGAGIVIVAGAAAGAYYATKPVPPPTETTMTAATSAGSQYPIPEIPYIPEKGTVIRALIADEPSCQVRSILNDEFERLTGIKVELEIYPWDTVLEKGTLNMTQGSDYYDVIECDGTLVAPFAKMKPGWIPLGEFEKENNLPSARNTMPTRLQQNMCEDPTTYVNGGTGEYVCVTPNYNNVIMAYRKDLFDDAGEKADFKAKYGYDLTPPNTHKQFLDTAKFLTRKSGQKLAGKTLDHDVWGTDLSIGPGMAFENWHYRYTGQGVAENTAGMGLWDTRTYDVVIDDAKANRALQTMLDLLDAGAVAPGALKKSYADPAEDIITGVIAMAVNWGNPMAHLINPDRNPFAKDMGFKGFPVYEEYGQRHMWGLGWGSGITQASKHKMEAFMWIYWWTRTEQGWKLLESGKGWMPFQDEILTSQKAYDMNPMIQATYQTMRDGDIGPPPLAEIFDVWDGYTAVVQKAMSKQITTQDAVEELKSVLNDILAKGGYQK